MMQISVHHRLESLKDPWHCLVETGAASVFQTYSWVRHWFAVIGNGRQAVPVIVLVSDANGRPVLLLPLSFERRWGLRVLEVPDGGVSDYQAPVCDRRRGEWSTPESFRRLWQRILRRLPPHDVLHLRKIPPRLVDCPNPLMALEPVPMSVWSYATALNGDWEGFYQRHVSKRLRADSCRQRRRLARHGRLSFAIVDLPGPRQLVVDDLLKKKNHRHRAKGLPVTADGSAGEFYRSIALSADTARQIHVSTLSLDDRILAAHLGLIHDRTFTYLLPAMDSGPWHRYSPGRLLMEELIRWSFAAGFSRFDMSIGDEPYKQQWHTDRTPLYEYLRVRTPAGALYMALWLARRAVSARPGLETRYRRLRYRL